LFTAREEAATVASVAAGDLVLPLRITRADI